MIRDVIVFMRCSNVAIECVSHQFITNNVPQRYKDKYFSERCRIDSHQLLFNVLSKKHFELKEEKCKSLSSNDELLTSSRSASLHDMHMEILDSQTHDKHNNHPNTLQMNFYLNEPLLPRTSSPMVFWKANEERFSDLAKIARVYLSAPCTSINKQPLLTTARCVFEHDQAELAQTHSEMLMFVKMNLSPIINEIL